MNRHHMLASALGLSILLAEVPALAQTEGAKQKIANGYPCESKKQCQSGYCYTGPGDDLKLCLHRDLNCPIPGGPGIRYYGEYNFDGKHWYCKKGVGLLPDGSARQPNFKMGGSCAGFFQKIDCDGNWFPSAFKALGAFCATAGHDPRGAAFCAGVEATATGYQMQTQGK